jgi:hypothetical protein
MPELKLVKLKEIWNMKLGLDLMLNMKWESPLVKMLLTFYLPWEEVLFSSNSKEESTKLLKDLKK